MFTVLCKATLIECEHMSDNDQKGVTIVVNSFCTSNDQTL